jgi:hypothetical protein
MSIEIIKESLEAKLRIADTRLSRLEAWHEGTKGYDAQEDKETLAEIERLYGDIKSLTLWLKSIKGEK